MTKENKKGLWLVLFGAIGGIWRAWFGGSFKHITRGVKYIVLIAVVLLMYAVNCQFNLDSSFWQNWRMYAVCFTFMYHWARSHGAYYDYNDHTDFAEDRHPIITKIVFWICGGAENSRTFWGNWIGMTLIYTMTAILVSICIPNALFLIAGVLVGVSYAIPAWLNPNGYYTKAGEVLAGITNFSLLYFCI